MRLDEYYDADVRTNFMHRPASPLNKEESQGEYFSRKIGVIDTGMFELGTAGFVKKPRLSQVFLDFSERDWNGRMNLQAEEWRNCPGLDSKYQISSLGRVRARLKSTFQRTFYVPTAEKWGKMVSWKHTGWKKITAVDHEYKLLTPILKPNTNGSGGMILHSVRWSCWSSAPEFGVRNGCMYGGRCDNHWKARKTVQPKKYLQERTDFLVALTFSSLGNPRWEQQKEENKRREEYRRTGVFCRAKREFIHYVVAHLNDNLWDCRAINVVWVDKRIKSRYKGDAGLGLSSKQQTELDRYFDLKFVRLEGYSYKFIAEQIGCSKSTVSHLGRIWEEENKQKVREGKRLAAEEAAVKERESRKIVFCDGGQETDLKLQGISGNVWTNKDEFSRRVYDWNTAGGLSYEKIVALLRNQYGIKIGKKKVSDYFYWGRALKGSEMRAAAEDVALR